MLNVKKRFSVRMFLLFIISAFLVGCSAVPVPEDKQDYIGTWKNDEVSLLITKSGRVEHESHKGAVKTSFSGPITEYTPQGFISKVFFIKKDFSFDPKPFEDKDGLMKIGLDGETLIKQQATQTLTPPSDKEATALTIQTLETFNDSVLKDDINVFYDSLSKRFRSTYSPEELKEIFLGFYENEGLYADFIKSNTFTTENLVFSKPPSFDQSIGSHSVEGYFVTNPEIRFEMMFIYEHPEWKPVSFALEL